MLKLPVYHSVISSKALIPVIHDFYDIGDVMDCDFLANGLNDTYILKTATGEYILRIYKAHWRNKQDVVFEVELLNHLNKKGIPVSFPVAREDGSYYFELVAPEGTRLAVLFTYAEGGYSDRAAIYTANMWLRCIWLWMISSVGRRDSSLIWIICLSSLFNRFVSHYPTDRRIWII